MVIRKLVGKQDAGTVCQLYKIPFIHYFGNVVIATLHLVAGGWLH